MKVLAHHLEISGRIGFVQQVVPDRPNGVTLLMIHTAGQSGVQWRHSLRPLAELGYCAIVPDLPGHGHSEPAGDGPVRDLSWYADWCVTVASELHATNLVVVGCSIGGKISQDIAVRHPTVPSAVVSMCAESGPGRANLRALERELEDSAAPARADRTHLGTRAVLGRHVGEAQQQLIARMHCREDPAVSNSDLIGWGTHDVRRRLAGIGVPVTFVAGEDDLWVDASAVERSASVVPNGRFVLLNGFGHYPMEEMDDFAMRLAGWIGPMLTTTGRFA